MGHIFLLNLYIYSSRGQNRGGIPEGDRKINPWVGTPIINASTAGPGRAGRAWRRLSSNRCSAGLRPSHSAGGPQPSPSRTPNPFDADPILRRPGPLQPRPAKRPGPISESMYGPVSGPREDCRCMRARGGPGRPRHGCAGGQGVAVPARRCGGRLRLWHAGADSDHQQTGNYLLSLLR